jgi:hypothetical protein
MPKTKRDKAKKNHNNQDPSFFNDQLGENAYEPMSDKYDNKENKKRK